MHARRHCTAVLTLLAALALCGTACSPGDASTFTLLHSFNGADGVSPNGALVQGADGNFYGTTDEGGTNGTGTVFQITPAGALTTLYNFSALAGNYTNSDGALPLAGLTLGADGNFYGTTAEGGANAAGTVFRITPSGTLTTLYSFNGAGADGFDPRTPLLQGTDGNFYGTNYSWGPNGFGGTVFCITPTGTFTILHGFSNSTADGAGPSGNLVQGSDGNFYGATVSGGAMGDGTIYQLTPGGAFTILHSFNGSDGTNPFGGLTLASDGNFYGTTRQGGDANDDGTVFQCTPAGVLATLHVFGASDGVNPAAAPIEGVDGNLYGTTGSPLNGTGFGTVYQISKTGVFTVLHTFVQTDGAYPNSALIQGSDGAFYGVTGSGGANNDGVMFDVTSGITLSPSSIKACSPGFTLTVHGALFAPGSTVVWDGAPLTTSFVSAAELTATVPASFIATSFPYTASVQVFNLDGTTSDPAPFHVLNPTPILSSLTPSSVSAGVPGFTLTVKGKCFNFGSVVNWNGAPLSTTYVSSTLLKATVPAALVASPGIASVTVSNPSPGGGASNAKTVTIGGAKLKVTGASLSRDPTTGVITAVITVSNTGFLTANNVNITKSSLAGTATTTPLPVNLGNLAGGGSAMVSLTYPASIGPPGATATLSVIGLFTGGKISSSLKVTLP